ncbi:unnamed protein product [Danaus chrysippus]|uniref:(African queen) hypothetical protein n=1 Tax=Danaus chrysippus TaxID=151541 RepID=A0A8J2R2T2_9NEOP|nr:unnamed protein product [Danaus chrysippus]
MPIETQLNVSLRKRRNIFDSRFVKMDGPGETLLTFMNIQHLATNKSLRVATDHSLECNVCTYTYIHTYM